MTVRHDTTHFLVPAANTRRNDTEALLDHRSTPLARLLYLHPGLVPPPADPRLDKFYYLSNVMEGEALTPIWATDETSARCAIGSECQAKQVRRFRHHVYPAGGLSGLYRTFSYIRFFVRKGLELHRRKPLDVVMVYGTHAPGIAGMILSVLTGAKLVPDLPNAPEHQYLYEDPVRTMTARLKKAVSDVLLHIVIWRSAAVKLLYPQQLDCYPLLRNKKRIVCHDFVPVRHIASRYSAPGNPVVLLIGHPWFRKGVDVAIHAFRKIASRYPRHRLVIVGWFPDRTRLEQLASGCDQIEFRAPVSNSEALQLIASCEVYVSASRSEGLARVLMEAMALGRPVIASATNGSPYLIQDNVSGLLFRRNDPDHLAEQLSKVLGDCELARHLGTGGQRRILEYFDETAYVQHFEELLRVIM